MPKNGPAAAWLRRARACLLWSCLSGVAAAQAATYAYIHEPFAYDTPSSQANTVTWHSSGAAPACTTKPQGDDDWADITFPGGFVFTFGGAAYTGVRIYSNGILAFGTDLSGYHRDATPQALPITAAGIPGPPTDCTLSAVPVNLMLPYYQNIVAGTAGNTVGASVKYELLGVAPNRRMVISWVNVTVNNAYRSNVQVVLLESLAGQNGYFKYRYDKGAYSNDTTRVGVQLNTTDYTQYVFKETFTNPWGGVATLWFPVNHPPSSAAEYRFDEGVWGSAAGEIKDSSGNNKHATKLGQITNVVGGKLCRGGSFTNNLSSAVFDAVSTPLVPGNQGSVSFWYKSKQNWNTSANAMLFDATKFPFRPFYLAKESDGRLSFFTYDTGGQSLGARTSTKYNFAAETWHHIAVTWSLRLGKYKTELQIIVDGAPASLDGSSGAAVLLTTSRTGVLTAVNTIYIGDNRINLIPFRGSGNGANGILDEVYIYDYAISASQAAVNMASTRPGCASFDHFHIVHSGETLTCGGALASIKVEAHDANHALATLSGTTMNLSTNPAHGAWSSIATKNPVTQIGGPDSGTATYTFDNENTVTFGLTNTHAEAIDINLKSGDVTEHSGSAAICVAPDYTLGTVCDAPMNFVDAAFQFDVPHHVAEMGMAFSFNAVKKDDNSAICQSLYRNTTRALKFSCEHVNPLTGQRPVRINNVALNTSGNTANACDGTEKTVNLTFNSSGVATPTLFFADAGEMKLVAKEVVSNVTISGTDTFVAAPKDFAFSKITGPFIAGSSFGATLTARNNLGSATPNYGKETVPQVPTVSFTKYQPSGTGAVPGSFSGSWGAFNQGVSSSTDLKWSEVGTIDLKAVQSKYLGSGLSVAASTGVSGAVGPFIPAYFETSVVEGCATGAYSYSSQPFTLTVTARNSAGNTTKNYDGSTNTAPNFAKVTKVTDANGVVGTLADGVLGGDAFNAGVANVKPSFTFAKRQTAPSSIRLRATDSDNVVSSAVEGTTAIRSGRATLLNAYGSQLLDLPMRFRTEYWYGNGKGWVQNTEDNCTGNALLSPLNAVSVALVPAPTKASTCVWDSGNPGLSGAGCAALGPAARKFREGLTMVDGPTPLLPGDFNLWLQGPGEATHITVTGNVPTWLQYPWVGITPINPSARATFGVYPSPLIYRRENY